MWGTLNKILSLRKFPSRGPGGRMDTWICMVESFHSSPETTTTLWTGYTPIQNKKFKVTKKNEGKKWRETQSPVGQLKNNNKFIYFKKLFSKNIIPITELW